MMPLKGGWIEPVASTKCEINIDPPVGGHPDFDPVTVTLLEGVYEGEIIEVHRQHVAKSIQTMIHTPGRLTPGFQRFDGALYVNDNAWCGVSLGCDTQRDTVFDDFSLELAQRLKIALPTSTFHKLIPVHTMCDGTPQYTPAFLKATIVHKSLPIFVKHLSDDERTQLEPMMKSAVVHFITNRPLAYSEQQFTSMSIGQQNRYRGPSTWCLPRKFLK